MLKGILQTSMLLCDEAFSPMAYEDWDTATLLKVIYTWNLDETTRETGIEPDFFSSMLSTTGIASQSNYASANTCLGSFAQNWTGPEGWVPRMSIKEQFKTRAMSMMKHL